MHDVIKKITVYEILKDFYYVTILVFTSVLVKSHVKLTIGARHRTAARCRGLPLASSQSHGLCILKVPATACLTKLRDHAVCYVTTNTVDLKRNFAGCNEARLQFDVLM